MNPREALIVQFLERVGWANAARSPLAGDASARRYERLSHASLGSAVLMDADPARGEDVGAFIRIAGLLTDAGLSAPCVLAQDETAGLLLLEDLGDDLFARVAAARPDLERPLYAAATDLLAELHAMPLPSDLDDYDVTTMTETAALVFDWYLAHAAAPDTHARSRFIEQFSALLGETGRAPRVIILRDYHAENLLWLPNRRGSARVGLLDFQDAMSGHPAYDLVSLLQDARRDVPPALETSMINRYVLETGMNRDEFLRAYHILGAQRNLRIIGVFARLCIRDGKPRYPTLLPRVWRLLQRDLGHEALAPVSQLLLDTLPAPDQMIINRLTEKCTHAQTP